jgi:hypothetical protein
MTPLLNKHFVTADRQNLHIRMESFRSNPYGSFTSWIWLDIGQPCGNRAEVKRARVLGDEKSGRYDDRDENAIMPPPHD